MNFAGRCGQWPQKVLSVLPFLLFFPVGVVYLGVVVVLLSLVLAGDYRKRWQTMRENAMFWPIVGMSLLTCVAALVHSHSAPAFLSGFAHYHIYLFLLLFVSIGKGDWQDMAIKAFIAGALCAATFFYLNGLEFLPHIGLFKSYLSYAGNKSILLGILLALAAGWLLCELPPLSSRKVFFVRLGAFIYIAAPVLFLTRTRTAIIILMLVCLLASLRFLRLNWRGAIALMTGLIVVLVVAWGVSGDFNERMMSAFDDVVAYAQGQKPSHQGIRLEIYALTMQIIAEKPWTGHGIATWEPLYTALAVANSTYSFATPHNDYLLYMAEMGIIGLAALLWIWFKQLAVGWRMPDINGVRLLMLGMALMVGGMFNAILRDAVFGMPFMILLAIPLAGVQNESKSAVVSRVS